MREVDLQIHLEVQGDTCNVKIKASVPMDEELIIISLEKVIKDLVEKIENREDSEIIKEEKLDVN